MRYLFMLIIFTLTFLFAGCTKRQIKRDMRDARLLLSEIKTGEVR